MAEIVNSHPSGAGTLGGCWLVATISSGETAGSDLLVDDTPGKGLGRACCRSRLTRAERKARELPFPHDWRSITRSDLENPLAVVQMLI